MLALGFVSFLDLIRIIDSDYYLLPLDFKIGKENEITNPINLFSNKINNANEEGMKIL